MGKHIYRDGPMESVKLLDPTPTWPQVLATGAAFGIGGMLLGGWLVEHLHERVEPIASEVHDLSAFVHVAGARFGQLGADCDQASPGVVRPKRELCDRLGDCSDTSHDGCEVRGYAAEGDDEDSTRAPP